MSKPVFGETPMERRDSNLEELQELCSSFHTQCSECHASLDFGDQQIETWRTHSQQIPPKIQFSELRCRHGHSTCAGCGSKPKLNNQHIFTPHGVLNHCCDAGRLFGIWVLLSRFDEKELKVTAITPNPTKKRPNKSPYPTVPKGVGYAGDLHGYGHIAGDIDQYMLDDEDFELTGMVPGYYNALHAAKYPAPKHKENERSTDAMMTETLRLLTKMIPPQEIDATAELNLFRTSLLFDRIVDLLRNDSIEDINKRCEMFLEICQFLTAIASHSGLVSLLIDDVPKKKTPGIRILGLRMGQEAYKVYSSSASLYAASANTYRQAKMFLKLVEKTDSSEDRKSSTQVCMSIIEIHDVLEKFVAANRPTPSSDSSTQGAAEEEAWLRFSEENRVTFTDDVLVNHRCERDFKGVQSSSQNGRLNTISKEVATLTTSLPTGIFVKIAESRMDVMKVLIVGSEGSPYAGGLFIFDIFLPPNYPVTPPKMYFVLDGNDYEQHSFNPNLHKGGTVCLSILNTWHGSPHEMWQPNQSTILSVLISVQAMILGAPMPWLNEPGMEIQGETTIAIEHKYLMQMKTIKYAMTAWIQNPWKAGTKEHIWKETVQTYWKYNSNKAVGYAKEWSNENPRLLRWANTPDTLSPRKKKFKSKAKAKGKGKATEVEETSSEGAGENLVEKLAVLLGIKYTAPQLMKREITDENENENGKRGADSGSSSGTNVHGGHIFGPSSAKKQKSETPGLDESDVGARWIYTGPVSQKQVRGACKEFGIPYKSTIADTIETLERHVNDGKGKVKADMVTKYGEYMEDYGAESLPEFAAVNPFLPGW